MIIFKSSFTRQYAKWRVYWFLCGDERRRMVLVGGRCHPMVYQASVQQSLDSDESYFRICRFASSRMKGSRLAWSLTHQSVGSVLDGWRSDQSSIEIFGMMIFASIGNCSFNPILPYLKSEIPTGSLALNEFLKTDAVFWKKYMHLNVINDIIVLFFPTLWNRYFRFKKLASSLSIAVSSTLTEVHSHFASKIVLYSSLLSVYNNYQNIKKCQKSNYHVSFPMLWISLVCHHFNLKPIRRRVFPN